MPNKVTWAKWFVLAFVAGFILPRSYGSMLQANTLTSNAYQQDYGNDVEQAMLVYHQVNNVLVNQFLEKLMNEDFSKTGYVAYPVSKDACDDTNVSTYCLAVKLNGNLEEFEVYMQAHRDDLDFDGVAGNATTLEDAVFEASARRTSIDHQLLLAEDTLDLTLSIYNQVQLVYPVHQELSTLIKNLEDYRGNLAEIRNVIEQYPSKFNGATTDQCQ